MSTLAYLTECSSQWRNAHPCILFRLFVRVTKCPPLHIYSNVRPSDEILILAYFTECSSQWRNVYPCIFYWMVLPVMKWPPLHILLIVPSRDEMSSLSFCYPMFVPMANTHCCIFYRMLVPCTDKMPTLYTVKKRFAVFPTAARMSFIELSLIGNNLFGKMSCMGTENR